MRGSWDTRVGGKLADNHTSGSIFGRVRMLNEHIHTPSFVYPWLANAVTLTAGGVWVLGALVEIIPAATITTDFDIHYIQVANISAVGQYVLELYYGAADTACGQTAFSRSAVFSQEEDIPIHTGHGTESPRQVLPANARIRAALASSVGGATADIKLFGHVY